MGMEVLHESRDAVASTPPSCMLGRCKQSEITSASQHHGTILLCCRLLQSIRSKNESVLLFSPVTY